jgi:phospholipid/cholesterol/gamma-HCH transport system permease protein
MIRSVFRGIGETIELVWRAGRSLPSLLRHRKKICDQFYEIGNASLLTVCILSFFIGGVLTLQTGPVLAGRGLVNYVGGLVGYSICRELAPVMMSILIAGRIGSAMASEIGSMQIFEEVDALRSMKIDPIHYLVLPRMVAIAIALPMLVLFAILAGWLGGAVIAAVNQGIDVTPHAFFQQLRGVVKINDVLKGLFKAFIFAIFIGAISCHEGFITEGGPQGIGRSARRAVVFFIVAIVILDYALSRFLMFFETLKT